MTAESFNKFSDCKKIECLFVSETEIEVNKYILSTGFRKSLPIKGITDFHRFVPIEKNKIFLDQTSNDKTNKKNKNKVESDASYTWISGTKIEYVPGQYVTCMFDKALGWGYLMRCIMDLVITKLISYNTKQPSKYMFSDKNDDCWIQKFDLLCMISLSIIPVIKSTCLLENKM